MKALGIQHGGVYKVIIDKELWVIVRIEDQTTAMFCPIHIMLEIPRHEPIERRPYATIIADIAANHKALSTKVDTRIAELGAAQPPPVHNDQVIFVSNRSAFKMAMSEYTKALTKFANDNKTALPTTRKGWNPVLEAAVGSPGLPRRDARERRRQVRDVQLELRVLSGALQRPAAYLHQAAGESLGVTYGI